MNSAVTEESGDNPQPAQPEVTLPAQSWVRSLIADVFRVTGSTFLGQAVGFVAFLVMARQLGPAVYGEWQTLQILVPYLGFVAIGSIQGLHRELPILRGRGDTEQAEHVIQATFSFAGLTSLIASLLLCLAAASGKMRQPLPFGLVGLALFCVFDMLAGVYGHIFRGENRYDLLGRANIVSGLSNLFYPALAAFWMFRGAVAAQVLGAAAVLIYSAAIYPVRFRFTLPWPLIRKQIAIGFPIMLLTAIALVGRTVDRYLILGFLTPAHLGYYMAASMFFAPLNLIFNGLNAVLYTRQGLSYGKDASDPMVRQLVVRPLEAMAGIVFPAAAALAVGLPEVVGFILPKYLPGVVSAQIILLGLSFYLTLSTGASVLFVLGRSYSIYISYAVMILLNGSIGYFFLRNGWGLAGAAIGASSGYIGSGLVTVGLSLTALGLTRDEIRATAGKLLGPFFWCVGIAAALLFAFRHTPASPLSFCLKMGLCLLGTAWVVRPALSGIMRRR